MTRELLQDKVVLVSGGTQGVGAAVVRGALEAGAQVAFSGRRAEVGERLARELAAAHGEERVTFVRADVADVAQARGSVTRTIDHFARIDGLVNCAATTSRGTLLDTTPELFDEHVAVNLRAPFFTTQAAVEDMRRRGEPGSIVNIISISAHGGQAYLAPYVAAKSGLVGMTKNLAQAHRFDRIRINGLNIGWTATEGEDHLQREAHDGGEDWLTRASAKLPMGKLGQPHEIADMVVLLLSDRSGVVTGSVIDWDQVIIGGYD